MVLIFAVFIGLAAGLIRAWAGKREYRFYDLRFPVLVLIAFVPQFFAFFLPATQALISDQFAVILLVGSQALLLIFSILNIKKFSFWPIIAGFLANFMVIITNGGLMPISPATIIRLIPNAPDSLLKTGQRLGTGKDIVLNDKDTVLPFLSDRFVTPQWLNCPVAFSLGDILISAGVIWLLWSMGGPDKQKNLEQKNEQLL